MFLYREKTGFVGHFGMIKYASIWDKLTFNRDAEIIFYQKHPENVIDICRGDNENDVEVWHYPHTRKDIVSVCGRKEAILTKLLENAIKKYPEMPFFTVDVETEHIIEDEDFTSFSPANNLEYNLFVFQGKNGMSSFPKIYCMARQTQNGDYKHIFSTQVFTSHTTFKVANAPTKFGKNLTYILCASKITGKFVGDKVPNLSAVDFPTNSRENIPSFLDTKALDIFAEKCGIDKVKKGGAVIHLLPSPKESNIIDAEVLDSITAAKEEISKQKEEAIKIQRLVLDKGSISLTNLMSYGVRETFACLPILDMIIPVSLDIGGIAQKMCLYQNKVYVIPANKETEWEFMLGGSPDFFIECTEDTFPTSQNVQK